VSRVDVPGRCTVGVARRVRLGFYDPPLFSRASRAGIASGIDYVCRSRLRLIISIRSNTVPGSKIVIDYATIVRPAVFQTLDGSPSSKALVAVGAPGGEQLAKPHTGLLGQLQRPPQLGPCSRRYLLGSDLHSVMMCCSADCCSDAVVVDPEALAVDREARDIARRKEEEDRKRIRILLLSTAEQVEMHEHQTLEGLTLEDLDRRTEQSSANVVSRGKAVDFGMYMRGTTASYVSETDFDTCTLVSDNEEDLVVQFRQPWNDPPLSHEAQVVDGAPVARRRTRGLVQTDVCVKKLQVSIYDVSDIIDTDAGWRRCARAFSGMCELCIHVVDLALYDQTVDVVDGEGHLSRRNGIEHALQIWVRHVGSRWFQDQEYALIFCNRQVMAEKLKQHPSSFRERFNSWIQESCSDHSWVQTNNSATGSERRPHDYSDAAQCAECLKEIFLRRARHGLGSRGSERSVFCHITGDALLSAMGLKFLFNAVVAIILEQNLRAAGLK
jgi:hypothetical protein